MDSVSYRFWLGITLMTHTSRFAVASLDGLLESWQRRREHINQRYRTISGAVQRNAQEASVPRPVYGEEVRTLHRRLSGCDRCGCIRGRVVRPAAGIRQQSSSADHRNRQDMDRHIVARIFDTVWAALVDLDATSRGSGVRRISVQSEND